MADTEKDFEADIERALCSKKGGWLKGDDAGYCLKKNNARAVDVGALIAFVKRTQPKAWAKVEKLAPINTEGKFYNAFDSDVRNFGLVYVLRHGFRFLGVSKPIRVIFFKPESKLNDEAQELYAANDCRVVRQWHYSYQETDKSVDMVLMVNGIPLCAIELKNQLRGQDYKHAVKQWMYTRKANEPAFRFNSRVLVFFAVDLYEAWMTTKLEGGKSFFRPYNQGSEGAGNDGGAGNPKREDGNYVTAYLWEEVWQKDKFLDILNKFLHFEKSKTVRMSDGRLVFPRYHQLDVVRKLVADARKRGAGKNYLIQHSAGSGKSNSIAWTAYRLASLHNDQDEPVFSSVVIVTDRVVLDRQLQATISSFDHVLGTVVTINDEKSSKDLLKALNDGKRLIVTTLQKFPVIWEQVKGNKGKRYAVIVDEAHSSQTGSSAMKLKGALADLSMAEKEIEEDEEYFDSADVLAQEMVLHGKHRNLSFFAFTATPKEKTLEMFGEPQPDGKFRPFHIYSMRQAIEEEYILDVLRNYMTYTVAYKISKKIRDNPELPTQPGTQAIERFHDEHPQTIADKAKVIVNTYREITRMKINGRAKMMVVTASRLAAVRYFYAVRGYAEKMGWKDICVMAAFSGKVHDPDAPDVEETEAKLNTLSLGTKCTEAQTKKRFHEEGDILIVAEKYQTGFDEPLLHTMIVDKRLKSVKAVQTLSRLNRIYTDKDDTYVLDFANKAKDIKDAFQPYYRVTELSKEIDANLIYVKRQQLAESEVYGPDDVDAIIRIYTKEQSADEQSRQGHITNALKPVVDRYNGLDRLKKKTFRVNIRSFVKWYSYITQIVRLFDRDLHKEYIFAGYLSRLLPREGDGKVDLDDALQLEYNKLYKTYQGAIELEPKSDPLKPSSILGGKVREEHKSLLDELIEHINQLYGGSLSDGDRVMLENLVTRIRRDPRLKMAKDMKEQMFTESIFRDIFQENAEEAYGESNESYQSLFQDPKKFESVLKVLAEFLYRETRRRGK